ncbi:MAG: SGNH/GDSL hydrolase family protein [Gemmatimonadales bacterium]
MSKRDSWRLKVLLAASSFILTLAGAAGLGEAAVRYRERHRSTVPGTMPSLFYRHVRLRHALVRNYNYYGWVHVNPQGFRGSRPVAIEKRAGTVRIMVVGGSTTFDSFVSADSAAWPARLETWLNRLVPNQPFEVINAGVPGFTMLDDLIRLQTELYRYRPDLIILYQGHNDLFGSFRSATVRQREPPQRPGEVRTVAPWTRWLERHSLLYGKVVERIQFRRVLRARPKGSEPSDSSPSRGPVTAAQEFERLASVYLAVAQSLHIPVLIPEAVHISGPNGTEADTLIRRLWKATVPFSSPETLLQGYLAFNQALERASARFGTLYFPMGAAGLAGSQYYVPDDPIHFNDRGADRFAEALARQLLTAGVLEPRQGQQ